MFYKPPLIYGERCDANASEAGYMVKSSMMETKPVAPTETERGGLTKKSQYATVRPHANDKHERLAEMTSPYLKKCSRCQEDKPLSDFYKKAKSKDGLMPSCKKCHYEIQKEWQNKNKDKRSSYNKKYYGKPEKKEKQENWLKSNTEWVRARARNWNKNNPYKISEYKNRRRVREQNGHFTAAQFKELCEKHENRCANCKKETRLEADHIIPVSKGGSNTIDNIQPLCRSCNARKSNKV